MSEIKSWQERMPGAVKPDEPAMGAIETCMASEIADLRAEVARLSRRESRDLIELGIMRDLLNDPDYVYEVGTDADYCTPTTDKLHALIAEVARLKAPPNTHIYDLSVEWFAIAMKCKLKKQRNKGYHGWDDRDLCTDKFLADKLMEHTQKGDPIDVANFAMMLHQRNLDANDIAICELKAASLRFAERVYGPIANYSHNEKANPDIVKLVEEVRAAQTAQLNSDWGDAAPDVFGWVVRSTVCTTTHRDIFRQRVCKSEHDQAQCYRQWVEYYEANYALTPKSSGVWWEISKHTVYSYPVDIEAAKTEAYRRGTEDGRNAALEEAALVFADQYKDYSAADIKEDICALQSSSAKSEGA